LEEKARQAYAANRQRYEQALGREQENVTIHPAEDTLVERLVRFSERYQSQSQAFYQRAAQGGVRHQDYYGAGGLYDTFGQIKQVADEISQLNQGEMKKA